MGRSVRRWSRLIALVGLTAVALVAWSLRPSHREEEAQGLARSESGVPAEDPARPYVLRPPDGAPTDSRKAMVPGSPPSLPFHPLAVAFGDGATPPEQEPAELLDILDGYRGIRGRYPTAEDNPGLMRLLTGRDAAGLAAFPPDHARFDARGALVDGWGTPFFFHHLSSQSIEVRSAGPDGVLFSDDDIVVPPSRTSPAAPAVRDQPAHDRER